MPEEMNAAPENGCTVFGLTVLEGAAIVGAAAAAVNAGVQVANAVDGKRAIDGMNHGLKKRC